MGEKTSTKKLYLAVTTFSIITYGSVKLKCSFYSQVCTKHAQTHSAPQSVRATYLWMALPPKGKASQAGRMGVHS